MNGDRGVVASRHEKEVRAWGGGTGAGGGGRGLRRLSLIGEPGRQTRC